MILCRREIKEGWSFHVIVDRSGTSGQDGGGIHSYLKCVTKGTVEKLLII